MFCIFQSIQVLVSILCIWCGVWSVTLVWISALVRDLQVDLCHSGEISSSGMFHLVWIRFTGHVLRHSFETSEGRFICSLSIPCYQLCFMFQFWGVLIVPFIHDTVGFPTFATSSSPSMGIYCRKCPRQVDVPFRPLFFGFTCSDCAGYFFIQALLLLLFEFSFSQAVFSTWRYRSVWTSFL